MWSVCVFVTIALLSQARADLARGGPHSVVGYFTGSVTLQCNRDAPGGVTWWYIAPGSDSEQPVPGRHTFSSSSYGQHSIRLENLQGSDAGMYMCRSSHDPQSFHPTSAFVVVVAYLPVCRANYTGLNGDGNYSVNCHITYRGLLNLTLSIRSDNYTIAWRNYTSLVGWSWWQVAANSRCQSLKPSVCRAQFYSSNAAPDVAQNRPAYIEVPCDPPPPRCVAETRGSSGARPTAVTITPDVSSQTTADDIRGLHTTHSRPVLVITEVIKNTTRKTHTADDRQSWTAAVSMSAIALILVVLIVIAVAIVAVVLIRCRKRRLQNALRMQNRQQDREGGGEQSDFSDLTAQEAREDDADKATSKLLAGVASKLSRNSSPAGNVNCSAQDVSASYHADANAERGRPSAQQPSNSHSLMSLHSVSLHSIQ